MFSHALAMVLLLALPRWASATYTTSTSGMTFGECESYCAGLGLLVACVTTDEEETELEGMLSGSSPNSSHRR